VRRALLIFLLLQGCSPAPPPSTELSASAALSSGQVAGFERAMEPRRFVFPQDHGSHPAYRNEWWYITGNLDAGQGRRFGFQVTFFRIALAPEPAKPRHSHWAANQLWMAHVALTDAAGEQHYAEERLVREAVGLAGARTRPFRVWVEDWQLRGEGDGFPWQLSIDSEHFSLHLSLLPQKPPVLQGEEGLSRKSDEPGNASYYYSMTRLATHGSVRVKGADHRVSGLSWLDREWSTSALGKDQIGWDWFSLQLRDGTDLMYYRLRNKNQGTDPHSAGSLVTAEGELQQLGAGDIELTPTAWWESPAGNRYPVRWQMTIKRSGRRLQVLALLPDQEMALSVRYWEGAVDVLEQGRTIGRGYMELTGY
jgi:predicted secreted hydrolase